MSGIRLQCYRGGNKGTNQQSWAYIKLIARYNLEENEDIELESKVHMAYIGGAREIGNFESISGSTAEMVEFIIHHSFTWLEVCVCRQGLLEKMVRT